MKKKKKLVSPKGKSLLRTDGSGVFQNSGSSLSFCENSSLFTVEHGWTLKEVSFNTVPPEVFNRVVHIKPLTICQS